MKAISETDRIVIDIRGLEAKLGYFGALSKQPRVESSGSSHSQMGKGFASQLQIPLPLHMEGQNML
jgi:hypothetical protein